MKNRICDQPSDKFFEGMKDTLFFQLHRIHLVMYRIASKYLAEADITIKTEQLAVLISIYSQENSSQQEIANWLNRDKSSIQRTVTSFEKKGLITILPDKVDKRRNVLNTTAEGDQIAIQVKEIIKKVEKDLFEILNTKDDLNNIESLTAIADKLAQKTKENI